MAKFVLCIIVGVVSLAAYNTMMAVGENDSLGEIDYEIPNYQVVNIVHRDSKYASKLGQCLDFNAPSPKGPKPDPEDFLAELVPCSDDRVNQFWTLTPEGFIRSSDKKSCLTYDPPLRHDNFVNVKDCDASSVEAKKWKIWKDGSITHHSHEALTKSFAIPHPFVKLEKNTHAPSQVWDIIHYAKE